jgi:hypothetical protein
MRPKLGFDILESGVLVVEVVGIKNRAGHRKSPMALILSFGAGVVKCNGHLFYLPGFSEACGSSLRFFEKMRHC